MKKESLMGISAKDNVQKFFGGFLIVLGLLLFFLGLGMFFSPSDAEDISAGRGIAIFSFAFIVPGALLLYFGIVNAKFEENVLSASSIAKSARRISLSDLALKMNCSIPDANKALSKAISLNLVIGNFDRTTDEFFTEEGELHKVELRFCPGCGAPLDRVYLKGETIKCNNCGVVL